MKTDKLKIKDRFIVIAIGLVYLWFGALKFVPHLSPAENLAQNTIHQLTFGLIADNVSIILLAIWEVGLGILLIFNVFKRTAIIIALVHMVLTFTPLLFFPEEIFTQGYVGLTLTGQYIIKNLIIIAALVSVYEEKVVNENVGFEKSEQSSVLPKIQLVGKDFFKKA